MMATQSSSSITSSVPDETTLSRNGVPSLPKKSYLRGLYKISPRIIMRALEVRSGSLPTIRAVLLGRLVLLGTRSRGGN